MKKTISISLVQECAVYLQELLSAQEQKLLDRLDRGIDTGENNVNSINNIRLIKDNIYDAQGFFEESKSDKEIGFKLEANNEEKTIKLSDIYDQLKEDELLKALDTGHKILEEKFPKEIKEKDIIDSLECSLNILTEEELRSLIQVLIKDEKYNKILMEEMNKDNKSGELTPVLEEDSGLFSNKEENSGLFHDEGDDINE